MGYVRRETPTPIYFGLTDKKKLLWEPNARGSGSEEDGDYPSALSKAGRKSVFFFFKHTCVFTYPDDLG